MDFLDEQEGRGQKIDCINRLRKRKQDLLERLEKSTSSKYDVQEHSVTNSSLQQDVKECLDILNSCRLLGVSIKSMGPNLVLRFDPLYRNQYPSTEHFSVQLLKKGSNYELGKHNLPPFIPVKELKEEYLVNGVTEFIEEIRVLLYAYIQRREGLKYVQKTFEKNVEDGMEVNLSVSYIKLTLWTTDKFPEVVVTLQYSLQKCLPDVVDIKPADSVETFSVSKKTLQHRLEQWKQILLTQEIFRAFSEIINENNS